MINRVSTVGVVITFLMMRCLSPKHGTVHTNYCTRVVVMGITPMGYTFRGLHHDDGIIRLRRTYVLSYTRSMI